MNNTFRDAVADQPKNYYAQEFEDCFQLDDGQHWFGQAESKFQQHWPINKYTTEDKYVPYVTGLLEDGASVLES